MGSSSQNWEGYDRPPFDPYTTTFYVLDVYEHGVGTCRKVRGRLLEGAIAIKGADGKEEKIVNYGNIFTNPYEALVDTIERNHEALNSLSSRIDELEYIVRNKVAWESS